MNPLRIAVLYDTGEGQTGKIASFIAESVQKSGLECLVGNIRSLPEDFRLESHDSCILGASVHAGRHSRQVAAS